MVSINEEDVRRLYQDQGLSLRKVATELKVSLATLSRFMKRCGIPTRNKASAQKNFLKSNDHQMKGRSHSDETKKRISHGLGEFWENLSDDEADALKKHIGSAWKRKWEAMSENERQTMMQDLANKAKDVAGQGSRFERFVAEQLRLRGYTVEERSINYIAGKDFEVDVALPKDMIAIEVDGPSHFLPIHGEEALQKQQERDERKNQLVMSAGYNILRIRDNNGALSQLRMDKIEQAIKEIKEDGGVHVWYCE